jgi:hypothetical protein
MSDEIPVDAEGSTRNKNYGPGEHLTHLLKIGHKPDSMTIKTFVESHGLHDMLREWKSKDPADPND